MLCPHHRSPLYRINVCQQEGQDSSIPVAWQPSQIQPQMDEPEYPGGTRGRAGPREVGQDCLPGEEGAGWKGPCTGACWQKIQG